MKGLRRSIAVVITVMVIMLMPLNIISAEGPGRDDIASVQTVSSITTWTNAKALAPISDGTQQYLGGIAPITLWIAVLVVSTAVVVLFILWQKRKLRRQDNIIQGKL